MHKVINLKPLRLVVYFVALMIFILVFIYAVRVQLIPEPENNLLSDFAIYLNNWLMPFITLGSLIALILTLHFQRIQLLEQQKQFTQQQNATFCEAYIQRFEKQHQRFRELSGREFPTSKDDEDGFNLDDFRSILANKTRTTQIKDALKIIERVKDKKLEELTNREDVIVHIYINELIFELEFAVSTLNAAYSYANSGNKLILRDLWKMALDMVMDLASWKIISTDKRQVFLKEIEIPDRLN